MVQLKLVYVQMVNSTMSTCNASITARMVNGLMNGEYVNVMLDSKEIHIMIISVTQV
jgi:hypothetical protein